MNKRTWITTLAKKIIIRLPPWITFTMTGVSNKGINDTADNYDSIAFTLKAALSSQYLFAASS